MTIEATPTGNAETERRKEIQVSKNKKPLFFYVNIAKEYMQQRNEAELSTFSSTYGGNKTESRVTDASLGVRAAQVERKRKLEEERKAARLALDKMENTDCFDDNMYIMREFEKLIGLKHENVKEEEQIAS